jgi:ABC-2 type transport system ATP-binding protein
MAPHRLVSGSTARDPVDVRVAHTGLIPIDVATLIGLATVDSSHSALDGLAPSASNEALQIQDLVKRYPTGVEALRGVSLDIQPGEFFGLLGPNGAGKSTLIHCATGLAQPTSGTIRVFGHDAIGDYAEARQAVGLAPQELNLDWFLTAEETLDYHAGYFGMPKRDRRERTAELLETFSLTEKRKERTRTLSGGMKRRLILARALMHRPRLLILDEPTAGVDIELRLELWHYVQRINAEGTTILLTTHYLEEAEQLCDKIAFINEGQIVAQGASDELAATYGVANLEDAYLALVGRKELSRSHVDVDVEELAS